MNTLFNKVFAGCNMELYINNPELVKRLVALGKVSDTMRGISTLEKCSKKLAPHLLESLCKGYINAKNAYGEKITIDELNIEIRYIPRKEFGPQVEYNKLFTEAESPPGVVRLGNGPGFMNFQEVYAPASQNRKKRKQMKINLEIAKICHAANQAYCEKSKLEGAPVWDELPSDVQESIVSGVVEVISDPKVTPTQMHQKWCDFKVENGWKYALNKDLKLKTHPNLVPFKDLPDLEKRKDVLFIRTVRREMKK